MEGRMKLHQLPKEEVEELLSEISVGSLGTLNADGSPYVVPTHFVWMDSKIYIHGLYRGQKTANIKRDPKVCFEIYEMGDILPNENIACNSNTRFRSVIVIGEAKIIEDCGLKTKALQEVVRKYTPHLSHIEFRDKIMQATGVIEITPLEITGKYYR